MSDFGASNSKTFLKLSFLRYLMLIGMKVYVKDLGLSGQVVDETKNSVLLLTDSGKKRVIKKGVKFIVYTPKGQIKLRGDEINMRPWEYAI